jgi:hypothetical protein
VQSDCETCGKLLNRLRDCTDRLQIATAELRSLVGATKPGVFTDAMRIVASLQMECQAVRSEVELHIAEHGKSH